MSAPRQPDTAITCAPAPAPANDRGLTFPTLDRGEGIALWRQIAQALERAIRSGRLRSGEKLPAEAVLAARFGVNRHTVRRAVGALEEAGLVRAEQGRGTFVHEDVVDYRIGERTRFRETLERQARDPERELVRSGRLGADRTVARALAIRPGDPVEVIELLGKADGRPISLAAHHFPAARFPGIGARWSRSRSITEALRSFGVDDYVRRSTRVTARPAEADEHGLLELPRRRPVLVAEAVNCDLEGTPVEYGYTRFAADRVQLVFAP